MNIMDQQIGLSDEALKDLLPTPVLQVQRDPALVSIEVEEQPTFFWVWNSPGEGTSLAGRVSASRVFDLDHLGSHVGHEFGRIGGRDHVPALNDPKAFQGASRHRSSFFLAAGQVSA